RQRRAQEKERLQQFAKSKSSEQLGKQRFRISVSTAERLNGQWDGERDEDMKDFVVGGAVSRSARQTMAPGSSSAAHFRPSVSSMAEDMRTKEEFKYSSELEDIVRRWLEAMTEQSLPSGQTQFAEALKSGVVLC